MFMTSAKGAYAASESHCCFNARTARLNNTRIPVLFFHHLNQLAFDPLDGAAGYFPTFDAVTFAGFTILSTDAGGAQAWGNDIAQARATDAKTYIQGTLAAKAGKVALIGMSMGATLALNWAKANPSLVSCIVLLYPAVNLVACHDATGGAADNSATINTAYTDLAGYNAAKATHDPAQSAGSFTGVPIQMHYSTNDAVVGASNCTAFATAVGGSAFQSVSLGASTHLDMSVVNPQTIVSFLQTNA